MLIRIIIALLLLLLFEYYFIRRLSGGVKYLFPRMGKKAFRIIRAVFLFIINIYPLFILINWSMQLINDRPAPFQMQGIFYDYFLIYPFWGGMIVIIQSVLLFILFEVIRLFLRFILRDKENLRKTDALVITGIVILSLLYVPARILYDYNKINFREYTISVKSINKDLEDFRLVFISDMQADRYTDGKRLQKYIDLVNNARPDLVLAGGDFITSGPDYIDSAAEYAGEIRSRLGVYSCIGDHDHWAYREDTKRSLREISSALTAHNVNIINDANIVFKYKSASVLVTFVTNSYVNTIDRDSLQNLISGRDSADLNILLTHQPRSESLEAASAAHYDLCLAGHTHGGQLTFLFPFINLSPTLFETKFVHGIFRIRDMNLIVSSGLGMSLAPFRYNSTPEVILIRFKTSSGK